MLAQIIYGRTHVSRVYRFDIFFHFLKEIFSLPSIYFDEVGIE